MSKEVLPSAINWLKLSKLEGWENVERSFAFGD